MHQLDTGLSGNGKRLQCSRGHLGKDASHPKSESTKGQPEQHVIEAIELSTESAKQKMEIALCMDEIDIGGGSHLK